MKSAVLVSPGMLEMTEREVPPCGPFDVLVAVEVCGVCRTDRKAFHMGQRDLVLPRVLGHEIVGIVRETGREITGFRRGDRVQVAPGVFCGSCEYCAAGLDHLCDRMRIIGFHIDGGFAELLRVSGDGCDPAVLNKVPEGLDSRTAALTEPLACGLNLLRRLSLKRAETVVIFGAGPLGILSAELARSMGAEKIAIIEPMERRRTLAAPFSDRQFDFADRTKAQILEFTRGRGADVVLPCCPGNGAFLMGLEIAAKRGQIGFFSGLTDSAGISNAALNAAHYRELTITGSYGCSLADNREALALLASGAIKAAEAPSLDISWPDLSATLSRLEPYEHIFTYFIP